MNLSTLGYGNNNRPNNRYNLHIPIPPLVVTSEAALLFEAALMTGVVMW